MLPSSVPIIRDSFLKTIKFELSDPETVAIKEEIAIEYEGVSVPITDEENTDTNTRKVEEYMEFNTHRCNQNRELSHEKKNVEWLSIEDPNSNEEYDKKDGIFISDSQTPVIKDEITFKYERVYIPIDDEGIGNDNDRSKVQNKMDETKEYVEYVEYAIDIFDQDMESSNENEHVVWLSVENNVQDPISIEDCDKGDEISISGSSDSETVVIKEEIINALDSNEGYDNDTIENLQDELEHDQHKISSNTPAKYNTSRQEIEDVFNDILQLIKDVHPLTIKEKKKMKILCTLCNRSFCWIYFQRVHINRHVGNPYKCDICNQAFPLRTKLKRHNQTHVDEKPGSSNLSLKCLKLRRKGSERSHKAKHMQEGPHKCTICGKGFKTAYYRNIHVEIHTKNKTFLCKVCGITSSSHKTIHICRYCGKHFNRTETLKAHILIHTGERPYVCNICSKSFRQRMCKWRHMKEHSSDPDV